MKIKTASPTHVHFSQKLIEVPVGHGLPSVEELKAELDGYWDVLLGREEPPIMSPYLSLAEVATAYFARALEISYLIHCAEREGEVKRGSEYYKFRTGEVRDFVDMAKRVSELGSRRLTQEQLLTEQRLDAGA